MTQGCVANYPPELLYSICAAVYSAALPTTKTSLDPLILADYGIPTALPSSLPPGYWPEFLARQTLTSLCLVNKTWYEAAKPWLWRRVEVRLPRNWLAFVDTVSPPDDDQEDETKVEEQITQTIQQAASSVLASSIGSKLADRSDAMSQLNQSVIESLCSPPDGSIPPELLSPPASRDPSPARLRARAKSPGRWRLMRAIGNALQDAMQKSAPGAYVPTPPDPRPGRHIQHLDFNHFRTIGMRRSVGEGVSSRFVTSERLNFVLKEMPNLLAFGATEYMDGALNTSILTELLFRGRDLQREGRSRFGHSVPIMDPETNEDDWERRRECQPLQAVDFCGCVSAVFVDAVIDFVETYLGGDVEMQEDRRGRRSNNAGDTVTFTAMRRLGLRGAKSIPAAILTPFVLAFPNLTHLDLGGTRCSRDLLSSIQNSTSLRLVSLALGRNPSLDGQSIVNLLIKGRSTHTLTQLSLYGDLTFPSPLSEGELVTIVTSAPCFLSGALEYLDLSSSPVTASVLTSLTAQPSLRSLGLAHIPHLLLADISAFIKRGAINLEVLSLVSTSPDLLSTTPARRIPLAVHQHIIAPLCTAPFHFSLDDSEPGPPPPTRLRVIELNLPALSGLGAGSGAWRIIRSKGGRGWYVDTASGWCAEPTANKRCGGAGDTGTVLRRDLGVNHPLRVELCRLADANGNVSSGIGWHARKMEVLHGQGLLGREDGLYGAVSFAYHS